jgi:hypothetical protein
MAFTQQIAVGGVTIIFYKGERGQSVERNHESSSTNFQSSTLSARDDSYSC